MMKQRIPDPNKVPEGYFQELEQNILAKTIHRKSKVRKMWAISIAASVLVAIGLWFLTASEVPNSDGLTDTNIAVSIGDRTVEETNDMVESVSSEDLTQVLVEASEVKIIETKNNQAQEVESIEMDEIELLMEEAGLVSFELDENLLGDIEI